MFVTVVHVEVNAVVRVVDVVVVWLEAFDVLVTWLAVELIVVCVSIGDPCLVRT